MKKYIIVMLISLAYQTTFAQISVSGKITDNNGVPIPGATISYSKVNSAEKRGTTTQENGLFNFETNTIGNYNVRVSYIGMKSLNLEKSFNELKKYSLGTLILEENLEVLQSIEIIGRARTDYNSNYSFSATKVAIKNKELPQAITSVTKELLADRQAYQLADAVKTVSNVTATGSYNHFNIRGITQADDGQIINGMRTRQYYFLQPITAHIERVEVIKGPSSVTFSSADPGGTINMVTKKPLMQERKEISITTGSYGTMRATADFTGPLNESKTLLYRFNAAFQEANSFRDLVKNNSFLITPSFSYIPDETTALNVEMIYSNGVGNLDRGQPIFGKINGDFDLKSTPKSLNVGASNDYFKSKEVVIMTNFTKKKY